MPAPLDPAAVDAVCAEPLHNARTLPADAYITEPMLDWERRHAIEPAWSCVARSSDLAKAGDQRAVPVGTETALLVRGSDRSLNAFYNACRHRGHELLPAGECVNRRTITCPYHAWVYNLQGNLKSATRFMDTEHFDASAWPLLPLRCVEWNGWVFVQADESGPSFTEWIGNLDEILRPYRIGQMSIAASHEYVVQANWKSIIENYLECYHCPSIHPELCRVSPPESAQAFVQSGYWLGGPMDLMDDAETMSLDGSGGTPIPGLPAELTRKVCYFVLPPNLLISPHPDYVMTPDDPAQPQPDARRMCLAVPRRRHRQPRIRPFLRREFLGRHQPAGLRRVRVGRPRPAQPWLPARPVRRARGRRACLPGTDRPLVSLRPVGKGPRRPDGQVRPDCTEHLAP
jgi:Rieske 2Fe-2S family protein